MSLAANKAVASRFIEQVWNAGDLAVVDALIHSDFVVPGVGQGPEAVKRNVTAFREAFPDLVWTIEAVIGKADAVYRRHPGGSGSRDVAPARGSPGSAACPTACAKRRSLAQLRRRLASGRRRGGRSCGSRADRRMGAS